VRLQSKNNVTDGTDDRDDHGNWIDQRLNLYFSFVASERLQLVTKWEINTLWGDGKEFFDDGTFRQKGGSGGGVGADAVNYEMKNVYIDFAIPHTPAQARLGVQGISYQIGWVVDADFSAARFFIPIGPVTTELGYIAAQNEDVTSSENDIDDWFLNAHYARGRFAADLTLFYQYGHKTGASTIQRDPSFSGVFKILDITDDFAFRNDHLFDLGVTLTYDLSWMSARLYFVKNFGSYKYSGVSDEGITTIPEQKVDYDGWMTEAVTDFFYKNFTFTVGGFFTSGSDFDDLDSSPFRYPRGVFHWWSEILGLGTLDVNVQGLRYANLSGIVGDRGGYSAGPAPTNIWTARAGIAWQARRSTKFTLNYWYIGTHKKVISSVFRDPVTDELVITDTSRSIGNELDFYIDQHIVDNLQLRLVGAYLFTNDGFTVVPDDDNAYEVGARLQWVF
jgi:hypothetical protein